jgi:hypothetical protein
MSALNIQYIHSTQDDDIELELKLDVYIPRNPASDDCAEIEILEAVEVDTGKPFPISELNERAVGDQVMKEVCS